MRRNDISDRVIHGYFDVKRAVIDSGYAWEIDLEEEILRSKVSEAEFLQELSWVVLSSGFRESVLRRLFPRFRSALGGMRSFTSLLSQKDVFRERALAVFASRRKVDAIFKGAEMCHEIGLAELLKRTREQGPLYLTFLPFIGSVTAFHLAKNIGLNVVKPDRHLVRFSDSFGFPSPADLCEAIFRKTGEPVAIIDTVLWRFGALHGTSGIAPFLKGCAQR